MELQITNKVWGSVAHLISNGVVAPQSTDSKWQVLGKGVLNTGARGVGCVAALVALVATPFFLAADLLFSCAKAIIGNVSRTGDIVNFYRGTAANVDGVTVRDIWSWDDQKLEAVHNYIQWIFPNVVPSSVNPTAPTLNPQTIDAMKKDPIIINNLRHSFSRMLQFYGLKQNGAQIERAANFSARSQVWLTQGNHNFLRISRILSSLNIMGLTQEAVAFRTIVHDIARNEGKNVVFPQTINHWK